MKVKMARLVVVLVTTLILIMTGACQSSTTPTISYPEPPTQHGNTIIASGSVYVTAKIMSITEQQIGFPWKADLLIQSFTEMAGLTNPVKDDKGKIITVYANQNMGSFKVNSVVTGKIRKVYDINWNIVSYFENVTKQ